MADHNSSIFAPIGSYPQPLVHVREKGFRCRGMTAVHDLTANKAVNDRLMVARLMSHYRLLPEGTGYYAGIASMTDMDFGDVNDPDALVDGQSMAAAGSVQLIKQRPIVNYNQPLWVMLGYATDPHTELTLFWTVKAALTGAANMHLITDLRYAID